MEFQLASHGDLFSKFLQQLLLLCLCCSIVVSQSSGNCDIEGDAAEIKIATTEHALSEALMADKTNIYWLSYVFFSNYVDNKKES